MSLAALHAEQLTQDETRWSIPPVTMPNPSLLSILARVFLGGEQTSDQVVVRCNRTLGKAWPWLPEVAGRYLSKWNERTRPRHSDVVRFLHHDAAITEHIHKLTIAEWLSDAPLMRPLKNWSVPPIETAGALADWLSLPVEDMAWFADLKALGYKCRKSELRHYRYRVVQKKQGGIRLIESPKPRLKILQRRILKGILNQIPVHEAVHGFRVGHSIETFASPHAGREVVMRMDLRDFFPSISGARVQTFFRTAGYPESVADLLGGICTNATPPDILADYLYARPHLPQGAPTSPALANLCAYRLDLRLAGLAKSANANYTRYADDLAFSGEADFARHSRNFAAHVAVIAKEEGFAIHHHKTRIMKQGVAQRLGGLTVNRHLNVSRADFDRLKATLTNCVRLGARSQNLDGHRDYRSHLQGRVAFVEKINPAKGQRLRPLFDEIKWG